MSEIGPPAVEAAVDALSKAPSDEAALEMERSLVENTANGWQPGDPVEQYPPYRPPEE
jgi:hypothetical protein